MTNEELYHRVTSEMLFNRAVMSVMAALVVFGARAEEPRCIFWYLVLYAAYNTARSFEEYMRGSNG